MNIKKQIALLERIVFCAKKAEIFDRMCLGFGTALGAVRPTKRSSGKFKLGFMEHDKDADVCFLSLSAAQKEAYYRICLKEGLHRWPHPPSRISRRRDNSELLWFSLRQEKGARCCNWFMFEWKGYYWHTKGSKWVNDMKFNSRKFKYERDSEAICKGVRAKYFKKMRVIEFEGLKINIPDDAGTLMDNWYPGWSVPRAGGASKKEIVCAIHRWDNEKSWRLL